MYNEHTPTTGPTETTTMAILKNPETLDAADTVVIAEIATKYASQQLWLAQGEEHVDAEPCQNLFDEVQRSLGLSENSPAQQRIEAANVAGYLYVRTIKILAKHQNIRVHSPQRVCWGVDLAAQA